MTRRTINLVGGVVLLGFSAVFYLQTMGTDIGRPDMARDPLMFPQVLIVLMATGAVLLIVRAIALQGSEAVEEQRWSRLLGAVGMVGAYLLSFDYAGFLISSLVFLPLFVTYLGYRRFAVTGIVTVVVVVGLWFVFADVFVVRPPGPGIDTLMRLV